MELSPVSLKLLHWGDMKKSDKLTALPELSCISCCTLTRSPLMCLEFSRVPCATRQQYWYVTSKEGARHSKVSQATLEGSASWLSRWLSVPQDLCSIPRTHMVLGENRQLRVVLWPPCAHCCLSSMK